MRLPHIDKTKYEPVKENTYEVGNVEKFEFPSSIELEPANIKKIVTLVRNSWEYKEYIRFLKEEINLDRCLILSNLSMDDVSIEMHHVGLTLFDVVYIVLNKYIQLGEDFTIFNVAEEVMHLHYKGMVMLCPLSITMHQLVHSGDVMIPYQLAYGDLDSFINEYSQYIPDDLNKTLQEWIKISNEIIAEYSVPIVERKYTYLEIDGVNLPIPIKNEPVREVQTKPLDEYIDSILSELEKPAIKNGKAIKPSEKKLANKPNRPVAAKKIKGRKMQ